MGTMHLPVGTTLQGGKYKIVRFLSSGGFGCTYEAEHVLLEKRMAVKEFFVKDFCNRDEITAHITVGTLSKKGLVEKLRKKFFDEAKSVCKLEHKGIVRVSDVFEENGTAYYVMDYIKGLSLGDIVKQKGAISEQKAVKYIRQVAEALGYVHEHNRLHLDVKPGNIMVDEHDNAILIDFGASKQYDEVNGENTSTLMGKTPGYAPPEQMGNDVTKFTPATDIYALGATFYKLLTGVTPLSVELILSGEELVPLPKGTSENVRNVISASMQTIKTKRPQNIEEFLSILNVGDEEDMDVTVVDDGPSNQKHSSEKDKTNDKDNAKKEATNNDKGRRNRTPLFISFATAVCLIAVVIVLAIYKPWNGNSSEQEIIDKLEEMQQATAYAQDAEVVKPTKPQKQTTTTTTPASPKPKPSANTNSQTNTSSQTDNSSTTTTPAPKPTTGTINGHEWVDLGLSVKWATCNVGASSPSDYGNYYAWGETSTKSEYTMANSKTYDKSMGSIAGNPAYDAARANWGGTWRLPTASEIDELINKCKRTWTTQGGHNGYNITGPNGNSIFVPAADWRGGTSLGSAGEYGTYWSATPNGGNTNGAYFLNFYGSRFSRYWNSRYIGQSVRPVSD